ncbi:MAG: SpoIIE family protein phosphatase [Proteobacteria bacterium]|nr:SpoIIE family protein phosphatase [Pseudomonadota bacterium]
MSDVFDSAVDCKLLFNNATQSESALILLRSKLTAITRRLGVSSLKRENLLLVASELVSNNVKHAAGRGMVQLWQQPGRVLDLLSLDYGPGIPDLSTAEADGYSTSSTLGKGLGAIRRLSDESYIYTQRSGQLKKWTGTVILARFYLDQECKEAKSGFKFGLYSRALSDERYNGDRIYLQRTGKLLRWLHLDGLGHGEEAQEATADLAAHLINYESPESILSTVDRQLTTTRGAVAITGEIDLAKFTLRLSGVGDMSAHIYNQEQIQQITFAPGILGREHRSATVFQTDFGKKSVIVTASDGIRRNWDMANFSGLFNQHPQLIAYTLGNIMGRISDDQSVCVCTIG